MVVCHFNFQFQVLALLKGTKELGVGHFTMDTAAYKLVVVELQHSELLQAYETLRDGAYEKILATGEYVKVS
jgi:hypothetical protein